ncbi:hypothetical protein BX661DRAFT_184012 [Kickxella alabastrina]|uniref:uncharacterized protein n=1 Tax=Kickxella alabastrina TaxID=61397 RepID=UPI0022204C90|nr:uncharacterized protein BX661DRAFT_184012 [Kickxella alabastrina]KAI7826429.1 hypothetical protein BX661DRAFT_184012 [Kickxella alabastrina]
MPAGEEGDAENEEEQQQQRQPPPPPLQRGPSRNRAQSQSIHQEPPRAPMRNYDEEPVVERLDLETGSISKRRGHARNGSEFGSASTLMNANTRDDYDLPKVVEEDVDSLASYSSLRRPHSPNLVGGGRKHPSTKADKEPFTLRGGGRKHPAFDEPAPTKACEAGCCGVCGEGVNKSDVVVRPQVMHASCLRCEACDCLLTSSTFRAIDGHVYCEADYQRFFDHGEGSSKAVVTRPKMSDKKFQDMNRAIMESFTSVDDFLLHMRQLRQAGDQTPPSTGMPYAGDKSKVQRAGDMGVDRQTHYEREQVTSPMGTPWITERVVDKKVKTKILEKRYPASIAVASAAEPSAPSVTAPTVTTNNEPTLVGGGAPRSMSKISRMDDMRVSNVSSASRPATSLLNDTKSVNGWEHPLCPGCNHVVYLNDRVVHESYGYHKACMRCHQCSQGALYCKKHGTELMRRRSILMRKKSTMGKRSRQTSNRPGISLDRFSPEVPVDKPQPPMPSMPMYSGNNSNKLPAPPGINGGPRRVTTALRNFLEAAASKSRTMSPEPTMDRPPASRAPAFVEAPKAVPKSKAKAAPPQMHFVQRPVSRSIFAGSGESLYDPNVVNALRQEAQRQINGSQVSVSAPTSPIEKSHRMLSPCGPSIADALQKYATSGRDGRDGRMSVSSQFDPFTEGSQYPLSSLASPQQKQGGDFPPNAQLDNLERRFRNANFRPPWALKSQTMFE